MKRILLLGVVLSLFMPTCFAADDQQSLLQAAQALMKAAANSDASSADSLLDPAFTATDAGGRTESRDEALRDDVTFTDLPSGNLQARVYGDVGVVTTESGKRHVMLIFAKRQEGWKALVFHEVKQADAPPAASGAGSDECTNPCKTVPYDPKNADEKDVILSWQKLETAVTAHNSAEWARHVADEFVVISSGSDHVVTKKDRIATLDQQKKTKTPSAPVPLVSAEMFDFPNAIVMISQHQRENGKPAHVTRVWVKRDGTWQMAYSFQTTMQQAQQSGN